MMEQLLFTKTIKKGLQLLLILFISTSAFTQSLPDMVKVEGGTFIMGDEENLGDSTEHPAHKVTVKTFRMARTETTVSQWQLFCNATARLMPDPPLWGWGDNHPIINISWEDAVAYCKWLSDSTKKTYRLPTEAEWEYAARGGKNAKGFIYAGGQSMYMIGWYDENSNSGTQPVAQKRPNELGLYDMSGNVWEWCSDWYAPYTGEEQNNPKGPATNENQFFKVLRGGSWNYISDGCRLTNRNYFSPESKLSDYGFRVVMEAGDEKEPAPATDKKEDKPPVKKKNQG